ncbi:hypothetical protein StoSoilB13_34730 (plasmid) [Arthrobacter sp. StoSoilB13]|nr:hypothetical protein StoSoilB13_34730 [Arthrobacter sp. StoSoilB13]
MTNVVSVGDQPGKIAVNPLTNQAYVAMFEGVFVINGASGGDVLYSGDMPVDVAVNTATNKIYVSEIGGSVAVVDGVTRAVTSLPVGSGAGVVAVNETSNKIYVGIASGVAIIDGVTNAISTVPLSGGAQDIVVNPVTNKVYVNSSGTIRVINAAGSVTGDVIIGAGGIRALAVNQATNKIYYTTLGRYGAGVGVIDGATDKTTGKIESSSKVGMLAVNPATNRIYVAADSNSTDGYVKVIDGGTLTEIEQIITPSLVSDIVVNQTSNKIYVPMSGRGTTIIDGADNSVSAVFTGQNPVSAAVNPSTGKAYVANNGSDSVSVIDGTVPAPVKNDFNGDGFADILAREASGVLWLYPGNGAGGWLPRLQVGQGWNVMTALVAPGDFNGDGHADVLARDGGGLLWLYPGNGSAGWKPRVQVGSGWEGMSAIEGIDFHGEGFVDVAARDRGGALWVYRGDGSGGWLPRMWVGSGWSDMSEITGVGDFNGDGPVRYRCPRRRRCTVALPSERLRQLAVSTDNRSRVERHELPGWTRRLRRRRGARISWPETAPGNFGCTRGKADPGGLRLPVLGLGGTG